MNTNHAATDTTDQIISTTTAAIERATELDATRFSDSSDEELIATFAELKEELERRGHWDALAEHQLL